ncbi:MAG: GNAT family N-acetyltransferase [Gammaproteobacteria bacterium]|nr:GNAT family N-acetyltransferase [Gammaproteobacteria bacterium]
MLKNTWITSNHSISGQHHKLSLHYQSSVISSLNAVDPEDWNALVGANYPFLYHQFLLALEQSGSINASVGWVPNYLILHDKSGKLVAAAPRYIKFNSFGEFVFDWAWADAYHRSGIEYYPKHVIAPPFTPATGPRLLISPGAGIELKLNLLKSLINDAELAKVSSLHILYPVEQDDLLQSSDLFRRFGYEFHWNNRNYSTFDDFLANLKSKRRKQIRKERKTVFESGVIIDMISGADATESQWHIFYELYIDTFNKYGNHPALTLDFFLQIAASMGSSILLIFATLHNRIVAVSFFLRGHDTLYGRYWGAFQDIPFLHFELCYYQALDYCIENRIQHFEPGAQGEHKISRGFLPTPTPSFHWIADPRFRIAIGRHVKQEQQYLLAYMNTLMEKSPYRSETQIIKPC